MIFIQSFRIRLYDSILIKKRKKDVYLHQMLIGFPNNKANLCVKAWQCLVDHFDIAGVSIDLKKHPPPGGGLGGGSSNAACVLKGLSKLYNLNIRSKDLINIGSSIGADVPFFINGGCQIGNGIGNKLIKINHDTENIFLLVMPDIHIDTKAAFKKFKKIFWTTIKKKLI